MRQAVPACLIPLLLCMAAPHADGAPTQVYLVDGELAYAGLLDAQANQRLFALYDSQKDKPTVLGIRSRGGPVEHGMALGRWVRAHKLEVKVVEYCLSSCANYVFPAALHKTVSNFAVIGYHGGPSSGKYNFDESTRQMLASLSPERRQEIMAEVDKMVKETGQREQAYLKAIGVRADLTTLGQQDRYQALYKDDPGAIGWTYSLDDFARLGVRDITVINPPWHPSGTIDDLSFKLLKLEE